MRELTAGQEQLSATGRTVRELIDWLELNHPGIQARLCEKDQLRPGIAVSIDGVISTEGIRTRVEDTSEVHFLPAISGGRLP